MTIIAPRTYRHADGSFWVRPTIAGRRTWRKLPSLTARDAAADAAALLSQQARAKLGTARDPFAVQVLAVKDLGNLPAPILAYAGGMLLADLTPAFADAYAAWRKPSIGRGTGARTLDLELGALSTALNAAVRSGSLPSNPLSGRKAFVNRESVRHCRDVMPRDAEEVHQIARALLDSPAPAVGWQFLTECFTGLRTREALALRMDAKDKGPGAVEGRYLYVGRSKRGVLPFVELHPGLMDLLAEHAAWHAQEAGGSPWYFPGRSLFLPLAPDSLGHALARVCRSLNLPLRTSHGCRAYYVTVWRSQGLANEQIAAMIGDRSARLIETVYGALPEVWSGGAPLTFLPQKSRPAWHQEHQPGNVIKMVG